MIFKAVQAASVVGFGETSWKRVSAANACVRHRRDGYFVGRENYVGFTFRANSIISI
jgi:hypothetical protein